MGQFRSRTREGATAKTLNRKNERLIVGEGGITETEFKKLTLSKSNSAYGHDLNRRANGTVNTDPRERSHRTKDPLQGRPTHEVINTSAAKDSDASGYIVT